MRCTFSEHFAIIIGTADPKREAWILNGFEPENSDEQAELERLTQELHFNPCLEAHRLRTISHNNPKEQLRDCKRVLAALTEGDFWREQRCWSDTSLDILRERGRRTGLVAYLAEIEQQFVPLLER